MRVPKHIQRGARDRIRAAKKQILNSLKLAAAGNPLAAEPNWDRLVARLQATALLSRVEAEAAATEVKQAAENARRARKSYLGGRHLLRVFGASEFVRVAFLELGMRASRAVARVALLDGKWQGSGVMISDRLFLTNSHVIRSPEEASEKCAEFAHELDGAGQPVRATRFALAPTDFFHTDGMDDLDYTVVAIGARLSGPADLRDYGWCPLSDDPVKHALGEVANIVQHPEGRYKEAVVRENRLVSRLPRVLHYVADTEIGSSGSPVFNNEWRMIALHHCGEPWLEDRDEAGRPVPREVNEGIRVSAILGELRDLLSTLPLQQRLLLQRALSLGEYPQGNPLGAIGPHQYSG